MLTQTQLTSVRRQAFHNHLHEEMEKNAVVLGAIGGILARIGAKLGTKAGGKAIASLGAKATSKAASRTAAKAAAKKSKLARIAKANAAVKKKGAAVAKKDAASQTATGQAFTKADTFAKANANQPVGSMNIDVGKKVTDLSKNTQKIIQEQVKRPMLGLKHGNMDDFRVVTKQKLNMERYLKGEQNLADVGDLSIFKNPLLAFKQKAGNVAGNISKMRQEGVGKFFQKEFRDSQRYMTSVKDGDLIHQVSAPRSNIGKVVNPLTFGTMPGMAASGYMMSGETDEDGKPTSKTQSAASAVGDAAMWSGPLAPVTMPLMTGKFMFDIGKSFIKPKKKEENV